MKRKHHRLGVCSLEVVWNDSLVNWMEKSTRANTKVLSRLSWIQYEGSWMFLVSNQAFNIWVVRHQIIILLKTTCTERFFFSGKLSFENISLPYSTLFTWSGLGGWKVIALKINGNSELTFYFMVLIIFTLHSKQCFDENKLNCFKSRRKNYFGFYYKLHYHLWNFRSIKINGRR